MPRSRDSGSGPVGMPSIPGDDDVPLRYRGESSVTSKRTRVANMAPVDIPADDDRRRPRATGRYTTTPDDGAGAGPRRRPRRNPSSAGSVTGQTTRRPVKAAPAKRKTARARPRTLPDYINPAPRRPRGIRPRGEGLDVHPRAYNWFGDVGGQQRINQTYRQLAGLAASAHPKAGVMKYGRGYTKPRKQTKKRARKTAGAASSGAYPEVRLKKLRAELERLAESMRRR